jgi:hypothetical protein
MTGIRHLVQAESVSAKNLSDFADTCKDYFARDGSGFASPTGLPDVSPHVISEGILWSTCESGSWMQIAE